MPCSSFPVIGSVIGLAAGADQPSLREVVGGPAVKDQEIRSLATREARRFSGIPIPAALMRGLDQVAADLGMAKLG